MTRRLALPLVSTLVTLVALSPGTASGTPSLQLRVEPRIAFAATIVVRGTAGEAGRLVLVVRNANGRVIGRAVRERVRRGRFGAVVHLNSAARPGRATVSGLLTGAGAFAPVRARATLELVKIEPNFLARLPSPWPLARPIPIQGRVAFPGRMVIVVRTSAGRPLGKAVVTLARRGAFRTSLRLGAGAAPGPVVVTATLRSGSLLARGRGTLRLV
jgi:hypothetical protein